MAEENQEKTVSEKFLLSIFDSLEELETQQRLMFEGCVSIKEFVEVKQGQMASIQNKNYKLFLFGCDSLLSNVKNMIKKEELKKIQTKINNLKAFEEKTKGFVGKRVNNITNTYNFYLKPSFKIAKEEISKIREMLVDSLWKILSPSAKVDKKERAPQ